MARQITAKKTNDYLISQDIQSQMMYFTHGLEGPETPQTETSGQCGTEPAAQSAKKIDKGR
jgi:hypothetical protein